MILIDRLPPPVAPPSDSEVRVLQVNFGGFAERRAEFEGALSPDERERANRFRQPQDRLRFVIARGMLRMILAGCVGRPPSELEFTYGERGKPQLKGNSAGIEFNVSHSEDRALFAIALNRPVGIDVEYIRAIEVLSLAKRFFRPSEYGVLSALDGAERLRGFFRLWTAKEAYLKATGEGLAGLEAVEFSLSRLEAGEKLPVRGLGGNWVVEALELGGEYCAAVAVED